MKTKYTVITGASSGIGRAVALKFAEKNKNLILIARRKNLLEDLKSEILKKNPNLDILVIDFDLTDVGKIPELYSKWNNYHIETLINNAGFGMHGDVKEHPLNKISDMLHLNVEALTLLSSLYVQDYHNEEGSQLINISSAGGYTIVPNGIVYCATKFYVNAFTEGLALELKQNNAQLKAKVLAPAATKTNFGNVATGKTDFDYDKSYPNYHTSEEMADFLIQLYESDKTVGYISRETFEFNLSDGFFQNAFSSKNNVKF